jgi:hypothetical protein
MKIAGGCFGCLALVFFALTLLFSVGLGVITSVAAMIDPDLAATVGTMLASFGGTLNMVNGSCCCLSSLLAIVLLAIGFSQSENAIE